MCIGLYDSWHSYSHNISCYEATRGAPGAKLLPCSWYWIPFQVSLPTRRERCENFAFITYYYVPLGSLHMGVYLREYKCTETPSNCQIGCIFGLFLYYKYIGDGLWYYIVLKGISWKYINLLELSLNITQYFN